DPANARRAEGYLSRAGVLDRVQVLVGDALDLLDSTEGEFDVIFNDVSKTQYPEVFRRAVPRVRAGGLFITDNVLWSGKVAKKVARKDDETRAIRQFNRLVYRSPDLFTTIIPLRDGLAVCEKAGRRG
ncbi:MAG TPA: class I SAM-dependent methyltransferase, partial [Terriglobia bacterium]|nr:class I SAM-dependent methyltransferase [Terriglobia bacterium]